MDEHAPAPLPHDPLWPRAGGWPALSDEGTAEGAPEFDAVLLGIGTWRTSLSPTGAHATPSAVREALRRYSPDLGSGSSLRGLRIADAGDLSDPDGLGETAAADEAARAAARGRLLIALGGGTAAHDWHTLTQGPAAIAHDIKDLGYVAESVHSH